MSEPLVIPEDLKERYDEALHWKRQEISIKATSTQWTIDVIECIARLEAANASLRAQVERLKAPVSEEEWKSYAGLLIMMDEETGERVSESRVMDRKEVELFIAARAQKESTNAPERKQE